MRRLTLLHRSRLALAVPCRSSRLRGWWTSRGGGELRCQHADSRRLRRMPPGPHRAGRDAPQRADRGGPLPDVPRRGGHGRHHGRHDRRPVRGRRRRPPRRHAARRPPRRRLRPGPDRVRRGRPCRRTRAGPTSRQNAKVPVRTAGSQAVTSAHLANTGGVIGRGRRRRLGQRRRQRTAYAGPAVDLGCAFLPQPARERRSTASSTRSPIRPPTGTDGFVPAAAACNGHRRGAAGRRRHPQLHRHPDERRHRDAPREPGRRARPAGDGGDYFHRSAVERHVRHDNDAPNGRTSATFTTADHRVVLTCHTPLPRAQGVGRRRNAGRDLQVPPHVHAIESRTASPATWRTAPTRDDGLRSATHSRSRTERAPVGSSRLLKVDNRGTCQLATTRRAPSAGQHGRPDPHVPALVTPPAWPPARRLPATRRPATAEPRRRAATDRSASPPRNPLATAPDRTGQRPHDERPTPRHDQN